MGVRSSSLTEAVQLHKISDVKRFLAKNKVKVNINGGERTALFHAVSCLQLELVDVLLAHKADPNVPCVIETGDGSKFKWSAVHEACRLGGEDVLIRLLDAHCDINLTAHHQMSLLHIAAWHGHKGAVQKLIDRGCDVNQLDRFKESAIVIPICHGDRPLVELLLRAGCKLNSRSWGNTRKIRGKHERDFRETLYDRAGPYSLFLLSVKYSWLDIAMLLLIHGFNPNKYQAFVLMKALKSSLGELASLTNQQAQLIHCFISAGYRFKEKDERLLAGLLEQNDHGYDTEMVNYLMHRASTPHTLKQLCRITIRSQLRVVSQHTSILQRIARLELPLSLIHYLALSKYKRRMNKTTDLAIEDSVREPLYFAMPRTLKKRNFYAQFWLTSCLGRQ